MRWLADENIQEVIIERLRAAGEDVLTVAEIDLSATDPAVVGHAQVHNRLLLTADKDFGDLVVRQRQAIPGVVLLRLHGLPLLDRVAIILTVIEQFGPRLSGSFTVIHRDRVRIRPLSGDSA
jgi:predicted nuclease of predicted toxin-antitoxin system